MESLPRRAAGLGRGPRLRRLGELRDVPAPFSVHRVDSDLGETACGRRDLAHLVRLDRPWEEWQGIYRCRECHQTHPMP
jgi:hypothetical protein